MGGIEFASCYLDVEVTGFLYAELSDKRMEDILIQFHLMVFQLSLKHLSSQDSFLRTCLVEGLTYLSPGMRYRHYAPRAVVTLVQGQEDHVIPLLHKLFKEQETSGKRTCVLCFSEHVSLLSDCNPHDIGSSSAPSETAHRLFDILRQLDDEGMEMVFSEVVPPEGVGLAVMNRLGRAASFRIIQA